MVSPWLVGAANFIFIFLKAFQTRNVSFEHYGWVLPTSFLMAATEVGVIGGIAITATGSSTYWELWPMIVALGVGGGSGAIASIWIHHRFIRSKQ